MSSAELVELDFCNSEAFLIINHTIYMCLPRDWAGFIKAIENFKWLFQIEDDEGIGGKCICVQPITIPKELSNC